MYIAAAAAADEARAIETTRQRAQEKRENKFALKIQCNQRHNVGCGWGGGCWERGMRIRQMKLGKKWKRKKNTTTERNKKSRYKEKKDKKRKKFNNLTGR